MSRWSIGRCTIAVVVGCSAIASPLRSLAAQTVAWTVDGAHMAKLIGLVGQPTEIAPFLAEGFEFREVMPPGAPQTKAQFLAGMAQMVEDYTNVSTQIDSIIVHRPDSLEARGRFAALYQKRTQFNLHFSITMRFAADGRVDRWWDHFRRESFAPLPHS